MKSSYLFVICLIVAFASFAQTANKYKVAVVGFYNLENFYDTVDNTLVDDNEFLPKGEKHYNSEVYWHKVNNLATVISQMATDITPDGPAILGVSEVENDTVLHDLINTPLLKKRNYQIVHYDSRDARGIDVALLYNPKYFSVTKSDKLFVQLPGGTKDAYYTRDVLWVQGKLDGETINLYVNHWPSRRGGEERSAPARAIAAMVCKHHIDSISTITPNPKVIIMGDLNDDPISPSVATVLNAKAKISDVKENGFYNPWIDLYKRGIGTTAYQDAWSLFDQIILSQPWLIKNQAGFFYLRQQIFNKEFMIENSGPYKGYPMRTWDGNTYRAGYSDHFPTFVVLIKKI